VVAPRCKVGKPPAGPRPDRWATLNTFVDERLAGLVIETGSAAVIAVWLLLYRQADGRTGRVSRLGSRRVAELTGLARNTARVALRALIQAGIIAPGSRAGEYTVAHVFRDDV